MHKQQVEKFYRVLWDLHDKQAIAEVLHPEVTFRGSLGDTKVGHQGFADYTDKVHQALGDYRCIIEQLVEEGDKVFAKMTFTGVHRAEFMGFAASGQQVTWSGAALFSFDEHLIRDIWVLGDLKGLENQLLAQKNSCV